jgi:hypothetical protein
MGVTIICLQVYLSDITCLEAPNGLNASIRTWAVSLSLMGGDILCFLCVGRLRSFPLHPYTYLWTWTHYLVWISITMRDTLFLTSDSDSTRVVTPSKVPGMLCSSLLSEMNFSSSDWSGLSHYLPVIGTYQWIGMLPIPLGLAIA